MTGNRRPGSFWAFLLAAMLSFGGIACIATGFLLEDVNLGILLLVCIGFSLAWTLASRYRYGVPIVALTTEVLWILPNARTVIDSQKLLIHEISSAYSRGYGWPVLYWDEEISNVGMNHALALIACIVSLVVVWVVFRQKKAIWAAVGAFLPLMSCLVLTDTVPDSEYLLLMIAGLLLLVLTNPLRRINAKQASRAMALLLVPVMLVTMGFFWAAPREGYIPNESAFSQLEQWLQESELWQWLTGNTGFIAGDSGMDEISLDTLGGKSDSDQVAFYVTATQSGYLYLRGRGYDHYDGKHWTASEYSSGSDVGWARSYTRGSVTVRMTNARKFYYFSGENGPEKDHVYFERGMLPNRNKETTYSFPWGQPLQGGALIGQMRIQCLQLPEETKKWADQVLQQEILPGLHQIATMKGIAIRIENVVRESAAYSLDPERMPMNEKDFAKWFFTEGDSGYCIHFATTATVLLRAAGIPARYVTGYALEVTEEKEMAVAQSRAHAWVEYFDENMGWTILDPTPGYNDPILPTDPTTEPTTEPTEPTAPTTQPTDPTTEPTTEPTDATAPTTQPTDPATGPTTQPSEQTEPTDPQHTIPTPSSPEETEKDDTWKTVLVILLWVMLACAAVWAQYRLRIIIRNWYMQRGNANQQALARWRAVRIRNRIFRQSPPEQLLVLAEKAKYSQHKLTKKELAAFDLHMKALAAKLQKKPWLIRWLLRLTFAIE